MPDTVTLSVAPEGNIRAGVLCGLTVSAALWGTLAGAGYLLVHLIAG